jgi:hypothetical protein
MFKPIINKPLSQALNQPKDSPNHVCQASHEQHIHANLHLCHGRDSVKPTFQHWSFQ